MNINQEHELKSVQTKLEPQPAARWRLFTQLFSALTLLPLIARLYAS